MGLRVCRAMTERLARPLGQIRRWIGTLNRHRTNAQGFCGMHLPVLPATVAFPVVVVAAEVQAGRSTSIAKETRPSP